MEYSLGRGTDAHPGHTQRSGHDVGAVPGAAERPPGKNAPAIPITAHSGGATQMLALGSSRQVMKWAIYAPTAADVILAAVAPRARDLERNLLLPCAWATSPAGVHLRRHARKEVHHEQDTQLRHLFDDSPAPSARGSRDREGSRHSEDEVRLDVLHQGVGGDLQARHRLGDHHLRQRQVDPCDDHIQGRWADRG